MLQDADATMAAAVATTLDALKLQDEDKAAKQLAKHYAEVIDNSNGHCLGCDDPECQRSNTSAWAMRWIAPLLLDALEALGATPAARARLTKGGKPTDAPPNRIHALRQASSKGRRGA